MMEDVMGLDKDSTTTENNSSEEMGMDELLGPEVKIEEGKAIKGRVIGMTDEGVLVDIGLKSEGLIPKSELASGGAPELAPGSEVTVSIVKMATENGHPLVSWRRVREKEAWERIAQAAKDAVPVEGTIRRKVKGGFIVDIGVDAFLPFSHLDLRYVADPDRFVGTQQRFVISEFSPQQKNIVVSRKTLLEKERNEKRTSLFATISEGQVVEGTITDIKSNLGAFVDIGGVDGLLHIGNIAWHHVDRVEDLLKKGQKIQVQILKIERETGRISLGMKQLSPKPWNSAVEKYPVGSMVKGKITTVKNFGVFVQIEPGIEGLLRASEISWDNKEPNVGEMFKVGQEIEAKVIALDPEKEKFTLSLKRTQTSPWEEIRNRYPAGTKVKGVVTNLKPFGAFVKLPEGVEGLVHVNDMSWTKKVRHPQDVVKEGQEVEAVVLGVDTEKEQISLSLKQVHEDPYRKYRNGAIVTGTVRRIVSFGAFVELEPGIEALVRIGDIAPRRLESAEEVLKLGQTIEAKVIKSDPRERQIDISIKKLEHDRERELVKKYVNKSERPTLGDILEEDEE